MSQLHQVWCVAYDGPTPSMDGSHPRVRTRDFEVLDQAKGALKMLTERSVRAEKRNMRIETRYVTDWKAA